MSSINSKVNILPKMELTKLSKSILLEKCQELGIKKYKSKSKSQLIDLIKSKTQNEDNYEVKNETKPLPIENKTLPSENVINGYTYKINDNIDLNELKAFILSKIE